MRRITGMILAAVLSLGLAACEGNTVAQIRSEASVITAGVGKETGSAAGPGVQAESGIAAEAKKEVADTSASEDSAMKAGDMENTAVTEESEKTKMNVQVGEGKFTATLEDNEAAAVLTQMMESAPVVISMSDYSGFEKVGSFGTGLPASNRQMTARAGDIVLYNGNQIVTFYGSNSWSYTKLGRIDDLTGWCEALGSGDVTVTFSVDQIKN